MRILFTRFPLESALGGAEIQTLSLMEGLLARGHAIAFLGSCPVMLAECEKRHIPRARLPVGKPPVTIVGAITFAWRRVAMKAKLRAALAAFEGIDAVVMMSLSEKLLMTDDVVRAGAKAVWLEHDRVGRWLRRNPWLPNLLRASRIATTVTVSELSRRIYLDLGWEPERVVAIPNGIDLERFAGGQAAPREPGRLRVGCVARLSPEKGVDALIQAVSAMPAVDLEIVGTGPDEGYLRKLADGVRQAEGLREDRIRIVPRVEDLGAFYRSIDALVLPSRDNDPFGLVAAEAMACGTATVVTDACGIAEMLRGGEDGLVVEADSEEALARALKTLEDDATRTRIAEAGRKTALANLGLARMIDAYEAVISKK